MSDTNYMNAYVNLVMETVHTNLNDILQLKTQTKLLNDLVLEKDQVISSLTTELEALRANQGDNEAMQAEMQRLRENTEAEMQRLRDNAATWETQYNNMINKVSAMDSLVNQHNELQIQFTNQTSEFEKTTALYVEMRQKVQEYEQRIETLTRESSEQLNQKTVEYEQRIETLTRESSEQLNQKTVEYEQRIETLNNELTSANKKIDRLSKKEEKKIEATPIIKSVAFDPPKVDINKEETKSTLITQKSKTVVVEKLKETDDDF